MAERDHGTTGANSTSHDRCLADHASWTVVDLVVSGMRAAGDAPAVEDRSTTLTHVQLDELSDRVAQDLHAHGVRRGDRVGLCIDRSVGLIAALVGVLKAGAAYVPMDPTYPRDRLDLIQEDASVKLTLVSERHRDWVGAGGTPTRVWEELLAQQDELTDPVHLEVGPEDAAFVVFTSGSTGRPKGVEMPHRALANLFRWQLDRPTFRHGARVLQYSSISFDVSFQEIATTLASGGHLFMVPDEERRDARRLLEVLRDWRIGRLFLPFVALRSLVEAARHDNGLPDTLVEVITAGEQLRIDDALREVFAARPATSLDNQYGPSETHVITARMLEGDPTNWSELPPIGQPIAGCDVFILDDRRRPVADGEIGELYLAGENLAHGYLGRPELTAERFVTVPIDGVSRRCYRSGDLGRRDQHGDIHYQGRVDHQVKIRGHRVEPGEINAVASRLPGVTQCLTHTFHKTSGAPFLVTYYVTDDGSVAPEALRSHLSGTLPEYMVPAFVIALDSINLGPSGKANLQALPDPRESTTLAAPTYDTDTERRLAAIWSDVLEFPNLDGDADFFDLGGDSLAAVTLFLRIAEEFGHDMPLATITQAPTIRSLAQRIDAHDSLTNTGFRSLQVLQEGAPGVPPLFLVHGGGGNVLIFAELAANLGPDQPLYAFQWSGWDGHRGDATVAAMAERYEAELRRFVPDGPYRLGGHCIGGLIVIELAKRLVAAGAEIDGPLIVSDAPNLAAASHRQGEPDAAPDSHDRFEQMAERLLDRVPDELRTEGWRGQPRTATVGAAPQVSPPHLDPIRATLRRFPWLLRAAKATRHGLQVGRIKATVLLGRELPVDQRLLYCTETMVRAAKRHRPTMWPGDVLYFRTATFSASDMALEGWWDDVEMGFGELCGGRFESHVVGGRHNEPLKLRWVADRIRRAYDSTRSIPANTNHTGSAHDGAVASQSYGAAE